MDGLTILMLLVKKLVFSKINFNTSKSIIDIILFDEFLLVFRRHAKLLFKQLLIIPPEFKLLKVVILNVVLPDVFSGLQLFLGLHLDRASKETNILAALGILLRIVLIGFEKLVGGLILNNLIHIDPAT